jgi:arylsulfatase A-like enzyme
MFRHLLAVLVVFATAASLRAEESGTRRRPNIVLIMADDMGHGDLGFHGNPVIRTPNLDRFARQSVRLKYFYVSPVCSPTRASLMTGRYNYRTGVVDTYLGRSLMYPDEVTLAEMLAAAGYRTGIFGKWHLGDNYPMRALDQGFHEALVLKGGGIGQPSDPPGGSSYFDPVLQHNGKQVQTKGYCSDVFTTAAIQFITRNKDRPFFVYLPLNAPHAPLQVPDEYYQIYKRQNLAHDRFPAFGHPLPGKAKQDITARVYGMVTNIDDNVGKLLAKLEELGLADDTIVLFLTDNGPQQVRYNSGMRDRKGSVHEGGVHVPCFIRWPAGFPGDRDVTRIAAHIDIAPTLLEACGVTAPAGTRFDGRSLLPLFKGSAAAWPERTLFFQWHRGDEPEMYRACAARSQKYRLVQPLGVAPGSSLPRPLTFELFDMEKDPLEMHDIAAKAPDIVARMKKEYEAWFKDVSSTRGYAPPRIYLGAPQENPVTLTRQDWRGPRAGWSAADLGHWEVKVVRPGTYQVTLKLLATAAGGTIHFALADKRLMSDLKAGMTEVTFPAVTLTAGPARLEAWTTDAGRNSGVGYVEVKRLE